MSENPFDRLAPHNVELEEAVLGCILLNNNCIAEIMEFVPTFSADSFYILRHSWIFATMLELREANRPIDNLSLMEALRRKNYLDEVGGGAYISHLINSTPSSLHVVEYAYVVEDIANSRRGLNAMSIGANYFTDRNMTFEQQLTATTQHFERLHDHAAALDDDFIVDGDEALDRILNNLADTETAPDTRIFRVPFPAIWQFEGFAETISAGKVILVQGISGGGKTTLAENMVDNLLRDGLNVIFWGGEWTPEEMATRRLQRTGSITYSQYSKTMVARGLRAKGVDTTAWNVSEVSELKINQAVDAVYGQNGLITTVPGKIKYINSAYSHLSLDETLRRLARFIERSRKSGITYDCITWDYVQLTTPDGSDKNWMESAIGKLKSFCGRYGLFLLLTSQVTKGDTRGVKSGNSTLNEASSQYIRADKQNLVLSITPLYANDEKLPYVRLSVDKNSVGKTGYIYLSTDRMDDLLFDLTTPVDKRKVEVLIQEAKEESQTGFKVG